MTRHSCGQKKSRKGTAGGVERQGRSSVAAMVTAALASLARQGESKGGGRGGANGRGE